MHEIKPKRENTGGKIYIKGERELRHRVFFVAVSAARVGVKSGKK
jgi:hypothetical protein